MTIKTQPQPHFIVSTEGERNTGWPDGSRVYCIDTAQSYILISGVFELVGPGGTSSIALDDLTDVVIASPVNNEVVMYSSGAGHWINAAAPGGAGGMDVLMGQVFS
jgi:hypothetical protein